MSKTANPMCAGWLQGFGAEMSVMADFPLNTYLMKHDRKWRLSSWRAGKWDACPFVSLTSLQSLTLEKRQCLGKLFTSTIKLPISQQAEDKGMKVFFPSAKWLIDYLLSSLLFLVSGPWQAPDLPIKVKGETLLLLYLLGSGLLFLHEMQVNILRISVRTQPEKHRNVTGLSLLSQGTVG